MAVKDKIRVAVLFGGRSGEHQVSLASARSVMAAMDKERYDIYPIGITKSGCWLTSGDPMAVLSAGEPDPDDAQQSGATALQLAGRRELVPGMHKAHFPTVDVVFPVLHGTYGEDGTVQGLLELADLPYVGAGVLGSALGLDKVAQKQILAANKIPVVDYMAVLRSAWNAQAERVLDAIEERFTYPLFTKPANLGSSVGISKASNRQQLRRGLELAARYDRKLLVEVGVDAREIECSVLGNEHPIASVPGEVVPCNEFYDYHAKYVSEGSKLHIPAELPAGVAARVRDLAVRAFCAIDCAGMARVDFFLCRKSGQMYVNELNTIPGFTAISMYPKLWAASGISYPELIDRLIALAIERHEDKRASRTSYDLPR
jgi:D-alanine-D-alanine ligase